MFEATADPEIRKGIADAHEARGAALRAMIAALFASRHEKGPCPGGQGPAIQGCSA